MKEWLSYIYTLHSKKIDLGLFRISNLAKKLSLVDFSQPVVMIAGTNGKGSIIKFLESIYLSAGYKVAAYTSPHLMYFNERLRLNGESVTDELWVEAFIFIESRRGSQPLSFFEFTTLAALFICKKQSLDILLLEVGLGGRLDAVNIVESDLAVISNIDIDHTNILGKDRESIGREKAGIIRPGKPIVCGDPAPPRSIYEVAHELKSPFYQLGKNFFIREDEKEWHWECEMLAYPKLPIPTLKLQNAATSLMALHCLQTPLPVPLTAITEGLKKAVLPGRFECIEKPAKIIFDVAHNPQSAIYLAEKLQNTAHTGRTFAVVGMLKDKDIQSTLAPMIPCIDQWYVGGLEEESRGADSQKLMEVLKKYPIRLKICYHFNSVVDAFKEALQHCTLKDRIVVFGSFHTVGLVKHFLLGEKDES